MPSIAQVAFDAATSADFNGTGVTQEHTVANKPSRVLVVAISRNGAGGGPSSVTYNGVAMTSKVSISQSATIQLWVYYLVNPTIGAHDVVISGLQSAYYVVGIRSYYHASQRADPFSGQDTVTDINPSYSVDIDSVNLGMVVDAITCFGSGVGNRAAGQNERYDERDGVSQTFQAGSDKAGDGSTITMQGSVYTDAAECIWAACLDPHPAGSQQVIWMQ